MDDDNNGPEVGDMVSLLAGCPKLCEPKVLILFHLGCLSLPQVRLELPEARFGSSSGVGDGPDLSEKIRPVQSYQLSSNPICKIFTDAASTSDCMKLLEMFAGTAMELGYKA